MTRSYFFPAIRDDRETEITVEIEVTNWGCAAQTYGDPSGCYDAEGMECEIVKATFKGETGTYDVLLTDEEDFRIRTEFAESDVTEEDEREWERADHDD